MQISEHIDKANLPTTPFSPKIMDQHTEGRNGLNVAEFHSLDPDCQGFYTDGQLLRRYTHDSDYGDLGSPFSNNSLFDPIETGPKSSVNVALDPAIDSSKQTMQRSNAPNHVIKHGLMTPPHMKDTESPDNSTVEEHRPFDTGPRAVVIAPEDTLISLQGDLRPVQQSIGGGSVTKRRRARKVTKGSIQDQQDQAQRRKARKGYKATTKEEEEDPRGEEKRQNFLARNRRAAEKSREKRKTWISQLEEQYRQGRERHDQLVEAVMSLQSELTQLREEALKHFDCDATLRQWLTIKAVPSTGNMVFPSPLKL